MRRFLPLVSVVFFLVSGLWARPEEVRIDVSVCQLLRTPAAFNHRLIRVRGRASLWMEDFTLHPELSEAACDKWPPVWLMFGGDVSTPTKFTGNDFRLPNSPDVKVEGFQLSLRKDINFKEFYKSISEQQPSKNTCKGNCEQHWTAATFTGRFFAGKSPQDKQVPFGRGYGHFGCCSLFVITSVESLK